MFQLGSTSGGYATSGYEKATTIITGSSSASQNVTNGIPFFINVASSSLTVVLKLFSPDGLSWYGSGTCQYPTTQCGIGGGQITLSNLLDRIRLTAVSGSPEGGMLCVYWE